MKCLAEVYGCRAESIPLVLRPCSKLGSIRANPPFFLNSEAGDQLILSVPRSVGAFADAQRAPSPAACSKRSARARSALGTRAWVIPHLRAPPKRSGHVFFRDFSSRLTEENREGGICLGITRYLPLWPGCCSRGCLLPAIRESPAVPRPQPRTI